MSPVAFFFMILTNQITILFCRKFCLNKKPSDLLSDIQGVSILKPLKGLDSHLEQNLESFFNLKYPKVGYFLCNFIYC